jgi:hypothetical protein
MIIIIIIMLPIKLHAHMMPSVMRAGLSYAVQCHMDGRFRLLLAFVTENCVGLNR